MKQTHVGTLTGSAEVALIAVAPDRVRTGLHVTLTSHRPTRTTCRENFPWRA